MRILADENIPFAREAFGALGPDAVVVTAAGRSITAQALKDVDLLIVRSVTKVNAELLAHADRLRFVGTCTIGTDHIDLPLLRKKNIAFASAPGSNADSVWEWFASTVLTLAERHHFRLAGKTLGVVGCGNVGERIARRAAAVLGLRVLRNDPPLAEKAAAHADANPPQYHSLDELCAEADILTCHTPLERTGPHPTFHLFNAARFAQLRAPDARHPGAVFLNAGRGEVVDGAALLTAIRNKQIGPVALDVWEHEPAIDRELLTAVDIATPHIAGYSFNGKVNATQMIHAAAAQALGREPSWTPGALMTPPPDNEWLFTPNTPAPPDIETALRDLTRRVYDVRTDDANLRAALQLPAEKTGAHFDHLRKTYPQRRECPDYKIKAIHNAVPLELFTRLHAMRFLGERIVTRPTAGRRPPSGLSAAAEPESPFDLPTA